jgi:hypothetical protein
VSYIPLLKSWARYWRSSVNSVFDIKRQGGPDVKQILEQNARDQSLALQRIQEIFSLICLSSEIVIDQPNGQGQTGASESNPRADAPATNEGITDYVTDEDGFYCIEAFETILSAGLSPSIEVYKTIMRVLSRSKSWSRSWVENDRLDIRNRLSSPTAYIGTDDYSAAAVVAASLSPADRFVKVFQRMVSRGVEPDLECYELLMLSFENSCIGAGNGTGRLNTLANGRVSQSSAGGSSGPVQTYPDRALEAAQLMLATELVPSRRIYESLLRIWVASRRADAPRVADSIFRSMVGRLCAQAPPSVTSFELLMQAWADSPLPTAAVRAEEVLQTMVEAGVKPTNRIYSLLAYAWSKTWRRKPAAVPVTDVNPQGGGDEAKKDTGGVIVVPDSKEMTSQQYSAIVGLLGTTRVDFSKVGDSLLPRRNIEPSAPNIQKEEQVSAMSNNSVTRPALAVVNGYVLQTEGVLRRCLEAGCEPDASMRRSLLAVWARDGSALSLARAESLLSCLSIAYAAAEELLATNSETTSNSKSTVLSKLKAYQVRLSGSLGDSLSLSLSAAILASLERAIESGSLSGAAWVLPHPSVNSQIASAWNRRGSSVEGATGFTAKIKEELAAFWGGASESNIVPSGRGKVQGLYVAYNLQLATFAATSSPSACLDAEVTLA